jgi:hypothetical protein
MLQKGNGHAAQNRAKAMKFLLAHFPEVTAVDESTIDWPDYGRCHFAAYTSELGAMISSPNQNDKQYGDADWHSKDRAVMFRDPDDGRVFIYVCPIAPLFDKRTIGHHGVRWADVQKIAEKIHVLPVGAV